MDKIVSAQWLMQQLDEAGVDSSQSSEEAHARVYDAGLILFDATYYLTDKTKDPAAEWLDGHIAGSLYFDVTTIADTTSPWPNTVPVAESFERAVSNLGMTNQHQVIAYDRLGLFSAARIWWLFRYFGHDKVAVLDGGLPAWLNAGGAVFSGGVAPDPGNFTASVRPALFVSAEDVAASVDSASAALILDARGAGRFRGESSEPRAGLRAGHIPGSTNLPFTDLLTDTHQFKPVDELREKFKAAGVTENTPVITSCGSGITACVISLGLSIAGFADAALFDGSWTEWGSREEFPVSTGG